MELRDKVNDVVLSTHEPSIESLSARISKENPTSILDAFLKLKKSDY